MLPFAAWGLTNIEPDIPVKRLKAEAEELRFAKDCGRDANGHEYVRCN
jgi:hypothetical protein